MAVDDAGLTIRAVDKRGQPVLGDAPPNMYNGYFPGMPNGEPPKPPSIYPAMISVSQYGNSSKDFLLYTDIDPTKIHAVYLQGSLTQLLTITGIPLDPTG